MSRLTDRAIKAGDLVAVINPGHCSCKLGKHFVVQKIENRTHKNNVRCTICCVSAKAPKMRAQTEEGYWWPLAWLKRIPPLDELESIDQMHKLDVREPA